jgi:hypothetical protein
MAKYYASTITSAHAPSQNATEPTYAHSAAQKITTHFHGRAEPDLTPPTDPFISTTFPSLLNYRNFYDTIIHRPPNLPEAHPYNEIYNRIVQPYNPKAFEDLLLQHKITHLYPLLVKNLRNGFPLGEMPSLTETVILENHPSAQQYPDTVKQYLEDEIEAGRMDGPFSRDAITSILRGPFFASPLIVSVQPQGPGTPDKLRVCRHLSKSNKLTTSVNSHVKKEDFPTRFDTASRVADIVSITLLIESKFSIAYISLYISLFDDMVPQSLLYRHTFEVITSVSPPSITCKSGSSLFANRDYL